ncbi:hypothetical protein CP02DC15_0640A, partial [Chlamydia psittaci 02DC15]
MRGGGGS